MIYVTINGQEKKTGKDTLLASLIDELDLPDSRIAVELNKMVIRKRDWSETVVSDRDVVEIVHFVGGG